MAGAMAKILVAIAVQKGLGWMAYQIDANPSVWMSAFGKFLARHLSSGTMLIHPAKQFTQSWWALHAARIFIEAVSDRVYDSSGRPIPDFLMPLANVIAAARRSPSTYPTMQGMVSQDVVLSSSQIANEAVTNQGVQQLQGNATINRFAKQIIINTPVQRMAAAKGAVKQLKPRNVKMTPEERKMKKASYMAQKRSEEKMRTGTDGAAVS